MNDQVRYTKAAREDLLRLCKFLVENDLETAKSALEAIRKSVSLLQDFPFTCRKATFENPFLREMVISFGAGGYVALFEIEAENLVTILAVRHQREEDYH
ncbi:MAG: type II toxin-antitoxin system RelE/ParE family toxin [Desulfuromonadaceae bacterium]|nr:type II toxin-antitoxin system RelE/ParE family toxin [Desulfuromonadaceae bacterium]